MWYTLSGIALLIALGLSFLMQQHIQQATTIQEQDAITRDFMIVIIGFVYASVIGFCSGVVIFEVIPRCLRKETLN
ncbi:hypothetical protein EBU71_16445 [bacterium]|nr:hypothetical protein [Candidatus Elulimicrobium humile]